MAKKKTEIIFDKEKMLLSEKSPFSVQEAYKTLRTNISFSLPDSECKCLGVVSASRGEGKSSVAINLAISYAQINKKVVVVDCDLRLPTIASKLAINVEYGLSNFLADTGEFDERLISNIPEKGIDIIASGSIPPDPTKLLESEKMSKLLDLLKGYYDVIIIDFPPVGIVVDCLLISKNVDGYLLVVRHNVSDYSKVADAWQKLEFGEANVIGFVYNGKSNENKYYRRDRYFKYYYKRHSK